jgi:hypothetical protein
MIVGDGLCSNIYVVGRVRATIIDAGVGNRLNPVWPQLDTIGVNPGNVEKVVLTPPTTITPWSLSNSGEGAPKVYVRLDTGYISSSLGESSSSRRR